MLHRTLFFALLGACILLLAALSQRHDISVDLTAQRVHSLTPAARAALDALEEPLEITAFVPDYPVQRAQIEHLLTPYLAHPGRPVLRFVDPVRQPTLARDMGVARHGELQLAVGSRREVIATPSAATIDHALNRLALRGERWIVSFKGRGENAADDSPAGLSRFVSRVENLGYRFVAIDPRHTEALPDNAAVLLIAAARQDYGAHTLAQIERFVERGGALLWLLDDPLPDYVAQHFGVALQPGIVVDAAAAQHGFDSPDNAIVSDYPAAVLPHPPPAYSALKQARGLLLEARADWHLAGTLTSSPRSWNETGSLRGQIARDPDHGERPGPLALGLALQRTTDDLQQRAVFIGGRHFISNDQIGRGDNMALAVGLLNWLTSNPLDAGAPTAADLDIRWSPAVAGLLAVGLMGVLPAAYLALGLWWRARRRRA
jgi:hypothetical protein